MVKDYQDAYRYYCWPVQSIRDLKLAPFHILATEKSVHVDKDHAWHMKEIHAFCEKDPGLFLSTACKTVDLNDPADRQAAIAWWESLTQKGGEGMVVKPYDFITKGKRGLIQPAVKVRGREYLRIIYGPEYTAGEHMDRLKGRNLGRKRSLALRDLLWALKLWNGSSGKNPCGMCMNVSLVCWPWKANPWTRDCSLKDSRSNGLNRQNEIRLASIRHKHRAFGC